VPRLTAHLTILDVVLVVTTSGIDRDFVFLAAIRAHHDRYGIRRPVSKREIFDWIIAVPLHPEDVMGRRGRCIGNPTC
jgi:hypothetical protein